MRCNFIGTVGVIRVAIHWQAGDCPQSPRGGAGRHERAEQRTTWRNGYRERALDTRLGRLNLKVPKLWQGSCFPEFLEADKTSEQALVAVIQEAWIGGVSTIWCRPRD